MVNDNSAVSAITLLANPVEIYLYGLQYLLVILSFIPFNLSLAYLYIPVYFNLKLSSAYEVNLTIIIELISLSDNY
jgi:hypothetical protein